MSKSILDELNARRKRILRGRATEIVESTNIPVEDLALPKEDHIEMVHKYFQCDENTVYPKWNKARLPDYRPGPVKIYTKAEIKEYEDAIRV